MAAVVSRSDLRPASLAAAAAAVLAALAPLGASAAHVPSQVRAAEALEAASARPVRIAVERGMPRSLSIDLPAPGATAVERARSFLSAYGALFHLDRPEVAVAPSRVLRPVDGVEIVRHAQTWGGIPVYGAHLDILLATTAAGGTRVAHAGASLLNPVVLDADPPVLQAIDATPRLRGVDAELLAYGPGGCAAAEGPDPRLEVLDPAVLGLAGSPRLAWHVARPRCAGDEALVDALTGEVLLRNGFAAADGDWRDQADLDLEDANGGTMNSTGCFNPTTMDDWFGDVGGILPEYLGDADAVVAWHGARNTYRTWHDLFGWHSFDGENSELEVYIHAGTTVAHGLASCGIEYGTGRGSVDTIAHEFGHMVIQAHSGYYKAYEPGALHEGLSDVSAVLVDLWDWTIGEETTDGSGAFRALDDPTRFGCGSHGPCPDRKSAYIWTSQDDGGVHWNAGIVGKAFYLLSEGGSFNGWDVAPLGRDRMGYVASLVMRTISDTDGFQRARDLAVAFASPPLDATVGLGPHDACAIRNAFRAVEIGYGDPDCDGVEEEGVDGDGDGVSDFLDNCLSAKNFDQADWDGDGIGDRCDPDGDNDGYADAVDPCWMIPNDFGDPDGDGIANCLDEDDDGDGVAEDGDGSGSAFDHPCASGETTGCDDNCALDANPDQYDGNANGFGDACDPDYDGDGVYDEDNCTFVSNASQADQDGDGLGDACDGCPDDADGTTAYWVPPCPQPPEGPPVECPPPQPLQRDADGDGIPDACDPARRQVGVRIDGVIASPNRFLSAGDTAREVSVSASGGGFAYAPLRLCASGFGPCGIQAAVQLEVVLSGLDLAASAWVEDASGVPLASARAPAGGDGTRGLRFRAAADGAYQLVVAPPAGFTGELTFAVTVRSVESSSPSPWRRPPIATAVEPDPLPDGDGDGLWDAIDLCPAAFEPTNRDGDRDRVGDACDACPATARGARVDPAGCSVADRCPCAPLAGAEDAWRSHGEYVSCVAHEAERFVALGLLTAGEKDGMVAAAAVAACGKR